MTQEKNDELWSGVFPMWKKRVMLTQWSGQAWDDLYRTFDFAADVRKIGMLMTVDGTNDDLITVDGVEKYTFTDADSDDLPVNERSDDDDEEEIGCAPTANFSVQYSKSLTVGVKKKKNYSTL